MKRGASESSEATSQATTTPPRTPKTPNKRRPAYYVQSPSHDGGGGGDKSSSSTTTAHTTPVYSSPLESPSHAYSTDRHSRVSSSATRFSGTMLPTSSHATSRSAGAGAERKGHGGGSGHKKKKNKKKKKEEEDEEDPWGEVGGVIAEEAADEFDESDEEEDDDDLDIEILGWCAAILCAVILVFVVICLIVWGVARRYKPTVVVESLTVHNFYAGEGVDLTGVPTKMVTINCSLAMSVHNPSTMFGNGIYVSSSSIQLMYSEIAIATGQLQKFYQPKKSDHAATAVLHGEKTPLYGAGATLVVANDAGAGGGKGKQVPLTLELAVKTGGHVIGRLVRVKHAVNVSCPVAINPGRSTPVKFCQSDCIYSRR